MAIRIVGAFRRHHHIARPAGVFGEPRHRFEVGMPGHVALTPMSGSGAARATVARTRSAAYADVRRGQSERQPQTCAPNRCVPRASRAGRSGSAGDFEPDRLRGDCAVDGVERREAIPAPVRATRGVIGVNVCTLGGPDVCVAQPRRDFLEIPSRCDKGRSVRVAQIVERRRWLDRLPIPFHGLKAGSFYGAGEYARRRCCGDRAACLSVSRTRSHGLRCAGRRSCADAT